MNLTAAQIPIAMVGETVLGQVSFDARLDTGELLTGTPTVTEITSADLTIDSEAVSGTAETINGLSVAASRSILFRVSGQVAGTEYKLRVQCATTSSPAQTLRGFVRFRTIDET